MERSNCYFCDKLICEKQAYYNMHHQRNKICLQKQKEYFQRKIQEEEADEEERQRQEALIQENYPTYDSSDDEQ